MVEVSQDPVAAVRVLDVKSNLRLCLVGGVWGTGGRAAEPAFPLSACPKQPCHRVENGMCLPLAFSGYLRGDAKTWFSAMRTELPRRGIPLTPGFETIIARWEWS